nr:hypothetical protein Iba_chr10eCG3880 [Ipomoea batatas]
MEPQLSTLPLRQYDYNSRKAEKESVVQNRIFQHATEIITSSTWLIARAASVYISCHASECRYLLRCHLNKLIPLQLSAALSSVESDPLSTVSSELSSGRICTLLAFFMIQSVNSDEDASSVIACLVES